MEADIVGHYTCAKYTSVNSPRTLVWYSRTVFTYLYVSAMSHKTLLLHSFIWYYSALSKYEQLPKAICCRIDGKKSFSRSNISRVKMFRVQSYNCSSISFLLTIDKNSKDLKICEFYMWNVLHRIWFVSLKSVLWVKHNLI